MVKKPKVSVCTKQLKHRTIFLLKDLKNKKKSN